MSQAETLRRKRLRMTKAELVDELAAMDAGRTEGSPDADAWADIERQKAYFEAVFRDVADAVVLTDPRRRVVMCNRSLGALFGYEPWEVLGRTTKTLYADAKDYRAQGRARFNPKAAPPPKPDLVDYKRKDGTVFPGETVGAPVRDRDGKTLGYLGIIRDVSERARAETETARFSRAIENLAEGVAIYDPDDRLVFCNEEYRRVHPVIADLLVPGARFEELARAHAERGAIPRAKGRVAAYMRERMEQHRDPEGPIIRELADGRWFIIKEGRTPDGGTYATTTDITQIKRFENELRLSQDQFVGAVAALQEGFALYDADDRLIISNDEFRRLHPMVEDILKPGMRFEDLVRANIERGVNADAVGREEEHIRERLERHRNPKGPIVRTLTDGTKFLIKEFRTSTGGVVVTETDITERERAREASERLTQTIENVPVGIALFDADDRLVFYNSRYLELMDTVADVIEPGVSFEDILRALVTRRPVHAARGRQEEYIGERMARHRDPKGPIDLRRDDKWLQASETRMADGSIFVIITDISEQKKADEALRESRQQFKDFADVSADWLWETDDAYRFTYVSERVAEIVGRPPEYFIGRNRLDNPGLIDNPGLHARHKTDVDARRAFTDFQYSYRRDDGQEVFVSVSGKPMHDRDGNFTGYRGTGSDITRRKHAEIALQRSEEHLRGAIDSMQEGFALFDADDRLVAVNDVYRRINPLAQECLERGLRYEDLIRANVEKGRIVEAIGREEAFVAKRLQQHRNPGGPIVREMSDGSWYLIKEVRTPDGGTALTFIDITEQKRAEEALRESEGNYRVLFENAAAGIGRSRLDDGKVLFANRKLAEMFGYDNVQQFMDEFRYSEHYVEPDIRERMIALCEEDPDRVVEVEFTRRDGSIMTVANQAWVDRKAGHIDFVTIDITDLKAAEAALRESEQRFRDIAENAGDWIWEMGADLRFTFLSNRFFEIFRVAPEHIIGKTRDEFAGATPDDERWRRHLDKIAKHEPFRDFEYAAILPSGHTRYIRISGKPIFDPGGVFKGYRGTGTDVTVAVEAEAAAAKAEATMRAAVESIDAGFALFDAEDRLVLYNTRYRSLDPAIAKLAVPGTTFREIVEGALAAGLYHDSMGRPEGLIEKRLKLHRETPSSHEQHYADGRWLEINEYSTHDGGTVLIWSDITERKMIERQLAGSQRMEALGKLTGGVAHDFNNLLTVILGNLQLLERRLPDHQLLRRYVELATGAAERGADLTKRLLAFSRRQKLDATVFEIGGLIADMDTLIRGSLGETITLETRLADDLWPVKADPAQLENALLNLMINAIDAMPKGGTFSIEAANATIDEILPAQYADVVPGDYVVIAVGDTGTGMSADVADHAFEPFFTTKDIGKGTGLGLSLVYGFVRQSGGYAKIYSEEGHGTLVKLYLPRYPGDEAALAADASDADSVGGDETILVVEDKPDVRRTAVSLLEELGYRVVEAEDGPSALHVLERQPGIDLLLTDVIMPGGMRGTDLAREVRKRHAGMKVLFMSGYTEFGALQGDAEEMDGSFLSKPFQKGELADKLRRTLDD